MDLIPLFPLNLVLFPGMPLNLHIFEERYKLMVNECIDERKPFGVVLIANKENDTSRRAEPHLIGCTAHITQVQPLSQGRMNISAIGRERFQVKELHYDKPYLSGTTALYPMDTTLTDKTRIQAGSLRNRLQRYLSVLQKARQVKFDGAFLPKTSQELAYLAAVLLQVEPVEKQKFLAATSLSALTEELLDIYRTEVTLLEELIEPPDDIDFKGVFSLN
jgi:uncharacterized protein